MDSDQTQVTISISAGAETETRFLTFHPGGPALHLGRNADSDIHIDHPKVSRVHGVLFHEDGTWHYSSLGQNGSFLHGRRIDHVEIYSGLELRLGVTGPELIFTLQSQTRNVGIISGWMQALRDGDETAAKKLWDHYFPLLTELARKRMDARTRRVTDAEDVALDVLDSLFRGISDGRHEQLNDREGLWRLLVTMTARRAINTIQSQRAQKRGGGKVRGDSFFFNLDDSGVGGIDQHVVDGGTPEFAVMLQEELNDILQQLNDPTANRVAELKLAGWTNAEIADELSTTTRTIERKLARIRNRGKRSDS